MSQTSEYYNSRFTQLESRKKVWDVLTRYLCERFQLQGTFLDLGCGYGDFINNVKSDRRFALDLHPGTKDSLDPKIQFFSGDILDFDRLLPAGQALDCVFSSNVLEHLERAKIDKLLELIHARLSPQGKLVLLLPNYKRAYRDYFDDYTHVTPLSDVALYDWLVAKGYSIEFCHPGFLPYSMKNSRIPVQKWLVRLWLMSPIKIGGKQMLFVARKK